MQTEVNHLADELYKFKVVQGLYKLIFSISMKPKLNHLQVAQMTDQNGAVMALGAEISADVLGIPMVSLSS